ncbi:MAG: metallophosphoesterase [Oscillospiraceae bacterium]|nr:metallophosphoesterase [Oscillospiraceae bacterium]
MLTSRYWLKVTKLEISDGDLPTEFDGFKIVHLSDLHGEEFGKGNSILLEKVRDQKPDIIVMTGDFLDDDTGADDNAELIKALPLIAPTYYVSGNHDVVSEDFDKFVSMLEENGIRFLRGEYELLERSEAQIAVAGIEDPTTWGEITKATELVDIMHESGVECFAVMLAHRNYWVELEPNLGVDIILCGHAHGGIIRLPFIGGLLGTDRTLFPDYVDGVTQTDEYSMVVSRGLGNSIAIPRFLNRPEIITIELKAE